MLNDERRQWSLTYWSRAPSKMRCCVEGVSSSITGYYILTQQRLCTPFQARIAALLHGLKYQQSCTAVYCWQQSQGKYFLHDHPWDTSSGRLISVPSGLHPGQWLDMASCADACRALYQHATVDRCAGDLHLSWLPACSTLGCLAALHRLRGGALRG